MIGLVFSGLCLVTIAHIVWLMPVFLSGECVVFGLFCFDSISFFLVFLSCLLWISLSFWLFSMDLFSSFMISASIFFSIMCYCCVHALWFWVFYEMSIVCLLVLLVVDSPYSERYIASWYLLGYVVLTSLPMLLCLLFLSVTIGSFDIRTWGFAGDLELCGICLFVLAVMFITKIPLPPFHVWLPIVHAEASSPVSVCLSGYIMKLGVLGVCRFCASLLPYWVFSNYYVWVCFFGAALFFFSASRELDGKRWLAFLSLSHILVASGCLCVGSWMLGSVSLLYCLGHGLSAGVIFLFLWLVYEVASTRNLSLLKSGISNSLFFRFLACSCLCTACSLPPTVQFFCEVSLAVEGGSLSLLFLLVYYVFLFLGGLVPLFLVGCILTRHYDISYGGGCASVGSFSIFFLVAWGFILFLVC